MQKTVHMANEEVNAKYKQREYSQKTKRRLSLLESGATLKTDACSSGFPRMYQKK